MDCTSELASVLIRNPADIKDSTTIPNGNSTDSSVFAPCCPVFQTAGVVSKNSLEDEINQLKNKIYKLEYKLLTNAADRKISDALKASEINQLRLLWQEETKRRIDSETTCKQLQAEINGGRAESDSFDSFHEGEEAREPPIKNTGYCRGARSTKMKKNSAALSTDYFDNTTKTKDKNKKKSSLPDSEQKLKSRKTSKFYKLKATATMSSKPESKKEKKTNKRKVSSKKKASLALRDNEFRVLMENWGTTSSLHDVDLERAHLGYYCTCGYTSLSGSLLTEHLDYYNEEDKYICGRCQQSFRHEKILKLHIICDHPDLRRKLRIH